MKIKRYIIVQAIKEKDNTLIPIWDDRIIFENTEMYGNTIKLKDNYHDHFQLIDVLFDLKTKKLETGIEINNYPDEKKMEFKKDQEILHEVSHRNLYKRTIKEIVYEEYDLEINKGKKFDEYWLKQFPQIKKDYDSLYAIKSWKPFYILDNDVKVEWEHQMYHIL
jgi:hypothetical protein